MAQRQARIVISDLWQGTSNQPDSKRRPGQVERADNLRLDPVDGASRRSGTKLIGDIPGPAQSWWAWTSLNQYIIRVRPDGISVIDRNNQSYPVNIQHSALNYLAGAGPDDIQLLPYLNSVLILNRSKVVQTLATPTYTVTPNDDIVNYLNLDGITANRGQVFEVIQSENENPAGFYQATKDNPTLLDWVRVARSNDPDGRYDPTTLPIQLLLPPGSTTFELDYLAWEDRKSGNTTTNKRALWVGDTIKSIAFWNNRFVLFGNDGFITTEELASRQEGFNLWLDDVATPVDTDPISLVFDLPNVGTPLRSAKIGNDLLVACTNGQIAISSGGDPASPLKANTTMRLIGSYKSQNIPLRANGESTVLIDENGLAHLYTYGGIVNGIQEALVLNDHRRDILSGYSVKDVFQIGSAVFIPDASSTKVAVHDRFVAGGQVAQLAWGEYQFDRSVVFMEQYGSTQYIVTQSGTTYSLLEYSHDNLQTWYSTIYQPHLDRMHSPVFLEYDKSTNETTLVINGTADGTFFIVDISSSNPVVIVPVGYSSTHVRCRGNLQGKTLVAGWGYTSRLRVSKLWIANAKVVLQRLAVLFGKATNWVCNVQMPNGSWITAKKFTASLPGSVSPQTGSSEFSLFGDARETAIELVCEGPGTATFHGLQYQVNAMEAT